MPHSQICGAGGRRVDTGAAVRDRAGDPRGGLAGKWRNRLAGKERAGLGLTRGGSLAAEAPQRAARVAQVHSLMLFRAAEALKAERLRWLDLGLVDTENATGLARFKLGTGAAVRRLGATCLVLPR